MFDYQAPSDLLNNRTILLTGASDGIGRVCAESFLNHGAQVILLGRSQEKLESAFDALEPLHPGRVIIHPLDFLQADVADYQQLASAVNEQFDCLDGLLHNAALLGARTPIAYYPEQDWKQVMTVNVDAAFHLSKALLPALERSSDGRILFTSSSVGRQGRAYWGAYGVSKFAVEGLMQTLAEELAETSRIRVNSFNPGATRTTMRTRAYPAEDPRSVTEAAEHMPAYLYLMGPDSAEVHGQALDMQSIARGK